VDKKVLFIPITEKGIVVFFGEITEPLKVTCACKIYEQAESKAKAIACLIVLVFIFLFFYC
jgi:hypothetical protein